MKYGMMICALALASAASAQEPAPDNIQLGAQDLAAVTQVKADEIVDAMPETAAKLVESRQEARALAALSLAYGDLVREPSRRKTSTAEKIISVPLYLFAQNETRERAFRSGDPYYGYGFEQPNGPTPQEIRLAKDKAGRHRAALAVHLVQQAGGCTGPMVKLLNRMRATDSTSGAADKSSAAGFARMALTDLGSTVYPPDESCGH